jgi:SAM-dependent methyltransferase
MSSRSAEPVVDPLDAPFDQYQRYRLTSDLASAMDASHGRPLSVLDVGGSHIDLQGRPHRPIAEFLPGRRTVTLDVTPNPLAGYVRGRGDALPFPDGAFDLVSSVDVLEHVPPAARRTVLREARRVGARAIVVAAPFHSPEIDRAEALVGDFIARTCGYVQEQLREHRELGWPDLGETVGDIAAAGWTPRVFPYGGLWQWTLMMIDKHAVQALAGGRSLESRLDRAYNEQSFALDRTPPCYRHFVLATRGADDPVLGWAAERLGATTIETLAERPAPSPAAVEAMFQTLAVHARNQELQVRLEPARRDAQIVEVEAHRQQAFEVLASQQAENARLNALLRSVEASPTFRLTSWARRLLGRRS